MITKNKITKDKSRFCLLLGDWCYKECPHYYYRDFNKCCRKPEGIPLIEKEKQMSNFKDLVNIVEDGMIPMILHIPDIDGIECKISIGEFIKMLRLLAPDDELWKEQAK